MLLVVVKEKKRRSLIIMIRKEVKMKRMMEGEKKMWFK